MSPKYPLEAALTVRRAQADAAAERLAGTTRSVQAALAAVGEAEAREAAMLAEQRRFAREQETRLELGLERAQDLAMAEACRRARELALQALRRELAALRDQLAAARSAEESARAVLAKTLAEQRAVERHREQWVLAEAAKAEQRVEEQVLEVWSAERFASGRH